jgi:ubiquinone/menaquinone biosynthesis C-methylase UbiE
MMTGLQFEQQAASGYDQAVGNMTRQLVPTLLRIAQLAPGQSVLDVASGTGIAAAAAAQLVGPTGRVTASDVSPAMIGQARERLGTLANVAYSVDDAQAMHFPNAAFDAVICNMGVMYLPAPPRGLTEMRRVLRTGGRVAVSVNTAPATALVSRILPIIDRYAPTAGDRSGPNSFDGSETHMRKLLADAGFTDVQTLTETRDLPFASFEAYFSGVESGAGNVGQEYVALPDHIRRVVKEEARTLVGDKGGPVTIAITITFAGGRR